MRIIICGGGTGGHIYPAISIAQSIKEKNPSQEILFIGAKGGMETFLIREAGFPIAEIWISGFVRWSIIKNLLLPFKLIYSYWKTKRIFKYFKPDIVIGTGGYVSAIPLYTALGMNIPYVIQEQNAVLGLTNKKFAKKASKIFVAYKSLFEILNKSLDNVVFCGNPIRHEIIKSRIGKKRALQYLGLDSAKKEAVVNTIELDKKIGVEKKKETLSLKKCVFVIGGSLGAKTINETIFKGLETIVTAGIQIVWQTGGRYFSKIVRRIPENLRDNIKVYPFLSTEDIQAAYSAADVVVARAGALTISELALKKKPAIFIPSPNVANNHQVKNIKPLLEEEAIIGIEDKNASKILINTILELISDTALQKTLSKNIANFVQKDAAKCICDDIIKIPNDIYSLTTTQLIKRFKYVYFLGIGGIGMSALAKWFAKHSTKVFGYDRVSSPLINDLKKHNISVGFEDKIRFMPREVLDNIRETLIVYTPAMSNNSDILSYVKKKEYPVFKRSEILGHITRDNYTIAVAGTHGKTSVSALLAHILYHSKRNFVSFIGGIVKKYDTNFIYNNIDKKNTIALVEADEYDKSFQKLHPNMAIVTSVDPDHLDIYKDKKGIEKGYKDFIELIPRGGRLIIQQDAIKQLYKNKIPTNLQDIAITYSGDTANIDADVRAANVELYDVYTKSDYIRPDIKFLGLKIALAGYHNLENALAAITAGSLLGIKNETIAKALATFPGLERRFEYILKSKDIIFINDYAHHPTEIFALLKSVKSMYPGKSITAIFQPHLYSRTKDFVKEFGEALSLADKIFLLPIYPAREEPLKGVSSKIIFTKIKSKKKFLVDKENIIEEVLKYSNEIILTLGAGDINDIVVPLKKAFLNVFKKV